MPRNLLFNLLGVGALALFTLNPVLAFASLIILILVSQYRLTSFQEETPMVAIPESQRLGDMPSGEPIPEGIYHVRCSKAEYKVSKEKKNPMVAVQFTVFGPPDQDEFVGRKLFENLMLTGEGMFRTRELLTVTGEDEDFVLEDTDQFLERECAVVVQVEKERVEVDPDTKEKKVYPARNKIARFMPIE